jgi:hypothetical protein
LLLTVAAAIAAANGLGEIEKALRLREQKLRKLA